MAPRLLNTPTPRRKRFRAGLLSAAALLAVGMTLPSAASAQVVFDAFDRETFSFDTFAGGAEGIGIGIGPTTGIDGTDNTALSVGINPGAGGGFAGVVIPGPGEGATDISGTNFLTFSIRPVGGGAAIQAGNLPLTLEINLQEDTDGNGTFEGATDDEFRAEYRIEMTGTDYQFVEIPLSSFRKVNAGDAGNGVLDTDAILQVVPVFGGIQGPEFSFAMDNLAFTVDSQIAIDAPVVFDAFDRETFSFDTFAGGAEGIGIGIGPTTGIDGTDNTALSVGINPGAGGGFAGVVIPGPGEGATDIGSADYLVFEFRPVGGGAAIQAGNLPLTLEINLQEDTDGNGTFEGATDDEFRAQFRIEAVGTDYQTVAIPLSSFRKVNAGDAGNGVLDTDAILQVVPVFGGIQGPEFSFAMDNLGFASSEFITADELPPSLAEAPLAFPNPTAGAASVTFALAEAGDVRADVFDVLGRRVATLADGPMAAGPVRLGVSTETFAPGTYVVRIATESGIASTRLTVVR